MHIKIPRLHANQKEVKRNKSRFKVLCCGRRWGKNILLEDVAVNEGAARRLIGWFEPTYKSLLEVWRELVSILAPITIRANSQEKRIELIGGGIIEFWSLDKADAGRGRRYHVAIINEAGFIQNLVEKFNADILPTLLDFSGRAYISGTPKGRNGFFQLAQKAISDDQWKFFHYTSYDNPHIEDKEIDALKHTTPERFFKQEYLAEFIDDAGGVFRGVRASATAIPQDEYILNHNYVIGADWGKNNDFTVLSVVDTTLNQLVHIDRFNQIGYDVQVKRLKELWQRFGSPYIIAETNAMGQPLIDMLNANGMGVEGFNTNNASKKQAIEDLSLAIENGRFCILNNDILIAELEAFEAKRLPSGQWRYEAPSGMHDDCVMSLAIAYTGVQSSEPLVLF